MNYKLMQRNTVTDSNLTSVSTFFNGQYIEDVIDGFKTLNVYGREMISRDFDTVRRPYADGSIRYGKTIPPRYIRVEYQLLSDTPEEQQDKFNQLMKLLNTKYTDTLRFKDEPQYRFFAEFEKADEVNARTLNIVSFITFLCVDPYKYGDDITNQVTFPYVFKDDSKYGLQVTKIEIKTNFSAEQGYLSNGRETIRFVKGLIPDGAKIILDFLRQEVILQHTTTNVRNDLIDLNSDFENFELQDGDTLTTPAEWQATLTITKRERLL